MLTATNFRYYESDVIDGTATGTFDIHTTVVDRDFRCLGVSLIPVAKDNVATGPVVSVGQNASDYNDIAPAAVMGGIVGSVRPLTVQQDIPEIGPEVPLKGKITTAATPIPLCTAVYTFKVIIWGYDRPSSE